MSEVEIKVKGLDEALMDIRMFPAAVDNRLHRILWRVAQIGYQIMDQYVPFLTGFLKSTLYALVESRTVGFGAGAHYSGFVEFGTRKMRAQPYIRPAVRYVLQHIGEIAYEEILRFLSERGWSRG